MFEIFVIEKISDFRKNIKYISNLLRDSVFYVCCLISYNRKKRGELFDINFGTLHNDTND